jgi:hypothetical protein
MRSIAFLSLSFVLFGASCDATAPEPGLADCRACTNPDSPDCAGCLGGSDSYTPTITPAATADQIPVSEATLSFAIIGDTRPAVVNDTAGYPTAVITTIFQDLEAESPRPGFAVGTGDYQFTSNGSTQTSPQLDLYLQARASFSNPEYPTMGNHECTGATVSNCGTGTTNGTTSIYNTYVSKVLAPLGIHNPYYSLLVTPPGNAWSAKVVFVAANAWTSTQASWLDGVLAQPTTYTFIVRHESSQANTAPGVTPSGTIIAKHPYTMLIVGHDHTYKHLHQKEVLIGNGGAPLTTGSAYGYGVVSQRSDGSIQFTIYNYKTHAIIDQFAVNADGSPATGNPPPNTGSFALTANPSTVSSATTAATTTISMSAQTGFTGTAQLVVTGAPTGATASLAATSLTPGGSTKLTLTPGTAPSGTYDVTVSGTSGSETEGAIVTWTINSGGGGGGGTCAHDLCTSGGKLASSCDACVAEICAKDSYCCNTAWSTICVDEVSSVCGETTCSGGSGSGSGSGGGACAHADCTTGTKLTSGCDTCVTEICAKDSYCCAKSWDATCVAEVGTICGDTCN